MRDHFQSFFEPFRPLEEFTVSDLEVVGLILRGNSVLNWNQLAWGQRDIESFCRVHRIDLDRPEDVAMIERIRDEAVDYLRENLQFPVPTSVRKASLDRLLLMASNAESRHRRLCACTLLKVMHVINHFEASEARQTLQYTDQQLFRAAERRIYRTISQMMSKGLPVVEFIGGRKQRTSMVSKLLSKDNPLSAQLFDKIRFRVITSSRDDVLSVIAFFVRNLFPFNYVLPEESFNSLIPLADYRRSHPHLKALDPPSIEGLETEDRTLNLTNAHSSPDYQVVHWVADLPLRVPDFEQAFATDGLNPIPRPVIYVRTELQILDRRAHRQNERGDASHVQYKERQVAAVKAKLLKLGQRERSS